MSVVESLDKTHYFTVANAFFPTRLYGESLKPLRDFRDSRGKLVEKKSRFATPK